MSDTPSDTSDTTSDKDPARLQVVRQNVGRSAQEVLQLIYSGVEAIADLKPDETRFIDSRSIHPEKGIVGTLVLAFADGETWYVEVEKERL